MKNYKWVACLSVMSLLVSGTGISERQNVLANTSDIHIFNRVITGENDGLLRYQYLDDQGEEVIPETAVTTNLKKAVSKPNAYDSREDNVITSVKDQGVTGCCWAFGALKSLEASSIQNELSTLNDTDLSENHLAWYTYTALKDTTNPLTGDYSLTSNSVSNSNKYNLGGCALFAAFTLSNWWGAVNEATAPFSAKTNTELKSMAETMNSADDDLRTETDVILKEANCYYDYNYDSRTTHPTSSELNTIKQGIMDHGALDVALYYPDNAMDKQNNLYQDDTITSLYQNKKDYSDSNHCVTIVGWDDSFNTFKTSPNKSGAWLIANSYGTDYGMDGYFWVSYYDTSLCEFYSFEGESPDAYDTNFQYDGFGWNTGYTDTDDIALANVFTNTTDSPQRIDAAGFYTYADGQTYQIEVYRNLQGDHPCNGEPVSKCSISGTADYSGYHTVSLSDSIAIAPGESFSVIVTFSASPKTGGITYALVEGPDDEDYNQITYSSSAGQSYVYFASEDSWYDNTKLVYEDEKGKSVVDDMNNVCVKALATTISQEEFQQQEETYTPETPAPSTNTTITGTPSPTPLTTSSSEPTPSISATTASPSPTDSLLPTVSPSSSATPLITDSPSETSSITLPFKKVTIGKGEKISLSVKTKPASAAKQLAYESSNKKIAVINSNGLIKGYKTGTAKITVKASSGVQKTLSVTVKKAPTSIKGKAGKSVLKKGKKTTIKTTLSKNSASYQIKYRSMNSKVISVNAAGKVTAKRKGRAKIQISTFNGKKGYVTIRVGS